MKVPLTTCAWLVALSLARVAQEAQPAAPVHLFVLSGQSNMAGLDPDRSFTPAVEAALGAENVVVVKDAKGGEPIHRWVTDWELEGTPEPAGRGALYERLMEKVRPAIEGRELASATLVWMQGERDAREQFAEVYAASLARLEGQLARDLDQPQLNFVLGRLSDFDLANARYPHWTRIRAAQEGFADASPRRAWVATDDLNDGLMGNGREVENDLHYTPAGYDRLGERFAQAALELVRAAPPPHIVLVMADDHGWGDVGYNGHPFVRTPALDAMAREALVFDRFYASAPVCSPTRASVLTGRSPLRTKVPQHGRYMRPQEQTLAETLRAAGYRTGLFGKFHLGSGQPDSPCNPGAAGFDEWVIGLNFYDNDPYLSRNGQVEARSGSGSVLATDDALAFLRAHKDEGRPLFTVLWFPAPHDPHEELPQGPSLYEGEPHAGYYREITLVDQQLGRLRSELRAMGLAENTLLWYCSDNGGLVAESSGGRARKGSVYEGGLRVPALLEWPARGLSGRCATPVWACDLYPTLLAYAGVSAVPPHPLDGVDLSAQLGGGEFERERPLGFWHNFQGGQSTWSDRILRAIYEKQQAGEPRPHDPARMRKDVDEFPQFPEDAARGHAAWTDWPWKLHRIHGERYELYDLLRDPEEASDLAADPAQAERLARMRSELDAWMRSAVRSLNGGDY